MVARLGAYRGIAVMLFSLKEGKRITGLLVSILTGPIEGLSIPKKPSDVLLVGFFKMDLSLG